MRRLLLILTFAAVAAAQSRDPLPVPDIPGLKTLKCDFHIHTVFSDGEVWPTTRVSEAWREGLDAIAITDHAGYNPHEKDLRPDLLRPYAIAKADADRLGIILVQGVEVMEGNNHCNAIFVTDPNAMFGLDLLSALRVARKQNAFVFWNHPGWKETPRWFPLLAAAYDEKLIQGIELVNTTDFYPEVFPWTEERKLAILADSDLHAPSTSDYRPRTRPVTLVFAKSRDAEGVREALVARRSAAWYGGEVWGRESELLGLWNGAVKIENPELRFAPGVTGAALRLRNASAIPLGIVVRGTAPWLYAGSAKIPAEQMALVNLAITRDAPGGERVVQLELEITNLHVAPGRNLRVTVPLTVEVGR